MTKQRDAIRGGTDYTGVSLEDIYDHFREWRESTNILIKKLTGFKSEAIQNKKNIDHIHDIIDFIDLSVDLFGRFLSEWDRLLAEIPRGVTEAHIEILSQIIGRSEFHEKSCVQFKRDHIEKSLRDESMRPLLDHIYAETRNEIINYSDLYNVIPRLKTYVGSKLKGDDRQRLTVDDTEVLELKPNVFGIGLNFNYLIPKLSDSWRTPEIWLLNPCAAYSKSRRRGNHFAKVDKFPMVGSSLTLKKTRRNAPQLSCRYISDSINRTISDG